MKGYRRRGPWERLSARSRTKVPTISAITVAIAAPAIPHLPYDTRPTSRMKLIMAAAIVTTRGVTESLAPRREAWATIDMRTKGAPSARILVYLSATGMRSGPSAPTVAASMAFPPNSINNVTRIPAPSAIARACDTTVWLLVSSPSAKAPARRFVVATARKVKRYRKESHRLVAGPMPARERSEERPTTDVSTRDIIGPASQIPSVGMVKRNKAAKLGTVWSALRWKGVVVGMSVSGEIAPVYIASLSSLSGEEGEVRAIEAR